MDNTFTKLKEELLSNPDIKKEYDALEAEYQIIQALIDLRVKNHLTQDQLAIKIGIPKSNISRFENRKHSPSIETLARFATGLNKKIEIKLIDI